LPDSCFQLNLKNLVRFSCPESITRSMTVLVSTKLALLPACQLEERPNRHTMHFQKRRRRVQGAARPADALVILEIRVIESLNQVRMRQVWPKGNLKGIILAGGFVFFWARTHGHSKFQPRSWLGVFLPRASYPYDSILAKHHSTTEPP